MIIWRGWGILVAVIMAISLMAVSTATQGFNEIIGLIISFLLSGIVIHFFNKELAYPEQNHLWFIQVKYWTHINLVLAVALTVALFFQ